MKLFWLSILTFVLALLSGGYFVADYLTGLPEDVERNYVGRESCIACHQEQAALFTDSHHDLAMDVANESTVLADFDFTLEHHGLRSRMYRDGERFMVRTDGPDGEMADFEVKYVFGVFPLQQYMVEMPQSSPAKEGSVGRLQVLRESWDVEEERWFYLNPPDVDERLDGDDPLHWTGITQRWNTTCAQCHSTNLQKNYHVSSQSFSTTFSEIDVSCEACHGPGSLHVKLANAASPFWDRNHGFGLAKLKTESNIPQVEMCGTCHSRRREFHPGFVAGSRFDDHFACDLLVDPIYHADGQIRDEDYVYGSFKQSKMFHQGIRCSDCHDPHSTKIKFKGNDLCTSCHQHPAGKYDSPAHHHHQVGSPGSMCVECHMPETTYMAVDPRRDHSLRAPRPDMSLKYSTPNACTGCHLEPQNLSPEKQQNVSQYLDWIRLAENGDEEIRSELERVDKRMAEAVVQWYGESSPTRTDSYYERFAKARTSDDNQTGIELVTDREVPAIIRASAAFQIADDSSEESLKAALKAIQSREPELVFAAMLRVETELVRLFRIPDPDSDSRVKLRQLVKELCGLLKSDMRFVRMNAARVVATLPPQYKGLYLLDDDLEAFASAFKELEDSTLLDSDRANSHLSLASLYEMLGQMDRAEESYRTAISVEPNVSGARVNLAVLLEQKTQVLRSQAMAMAQQGEREKFQSLMQNVQSLGQQAAQLRKEEHRLLAVDVKRAEGLSNTHLLHYRYAMSCYLQKEFELTEKHLKIALSQQPDSQDYLAALVAFYEFDGQPDKVAEYNRRLNEVNKK